MTFIQKRGLILITLFVTLMHVWVLLINFDSYRTWFYKKYVSKSNPIRVNWATNFQPSGSANQNDTVFSDSAGSAKGPTNDPPASSTVRRSSFVISENPSSSELEANFRNSQKLQQIHLNNEFQVRSANTQNALRDVKEIFFKNAHGNERKRCCVVTLQRSQASCNAKELTEFYQNVFESLQTRMIDLAREGIKEFCD